MLAVTGMGMVSALGLDVVSSCAAARAGVRRIIEVDDLYVSDADGNETTQVAVHRVPRISAGLFGFTRLLQLGLASLADLQHTNGSLKESRLGLIVLVDSGIYHDAWSRRILQNGSNPEENDGHAAFRAVRDRIARDLLGALVQRAGLNVPAGARATWSSSAVGFVAALLQAEEWLGRGTCERCIVGGIDSLLDPQTLASLDGLRLLKTPDRAVGIIPGEAASFLVVEQPRGAVIRRAPIHALLDSPVQAREAANPLVAEDGAGGGGLRTAISETLARLPDGGRSTGIVVANLNGDPYRAASWGRSLVVADSPLKLGELPLWIPPLAFGDIGAASGPLSIAMLARGWSRGYAPPSDGLICLMDDAGARGTVYVRTPRERAA